MRVIRQIASVLSILPIVLLVMGLYAGKVQLIYQEAVVQVPFHCIYFLIPTAASCIWFWASKNGRVTIKQPKKIEDVGKEFFKADWVPEPPPLSPKPPKPKVRVKSRAKFAELPEEFHIDLR